MAPSRFMKKSIHTSSEDIFYLPRKCLQENLLHAKCEDEDKLEEKMMSKDEDEE